jgi:hypothetical protein
MRPPRSQPEPATAVALNIWGEARVNGRSVPPSRHQAEQAHLAVAQGIWCRILVPRTTSASIRPAMGGTVGRYSRCGCRREYADGSGQRCSRLGSPVTEAVHAAAGELDVGVGARSTVGGRLVCPPPGGRRLWMGVASSHDLWWADDVAGPWQHTVVPLPAGACISAVAVSGSHAMWLATAPRLGQPGADLPGRLYRSDDGGASWSPLALRVH